MKVYWVKLRVDAGDRYGSFGSHCDERIVLLKCCPDLGGEIVEVASLYPVVACKLMGNGRPVDVTRRKMLKQCLASSACVSATMPSRAGHRNASGRATKFRAWCAYPHDHLGIPLTSFYEYAAQERHHQHRSEITKEYATYQAAVSDVASADFSANCMHDGDESTAWSSGIRTPAGEAWFAFWFPKNLVNMVKLTPRRSGGVSLCFPETLTIEYSTDNGWKPVRTVTNLAQPGPEGCVTISLDRTIDTDGFRICARGLRKDNYGNHYLQIADGKAALHTWDFDAAKVTGAAEKFPEALFYFGDEPDMFTTADEYASVYDRFVECVKTASKLARVSPANFTFDNAIHGSTLSEYASKFHAAAKAEIDEYRFASFVTQRDAHKTTYSPLAEWSADHGKGMVIGSFGMHPAPQEADVTAALTKQMKDIKNDVRIVEANYWTYNIFETYPNGPKFFHTLVTPFTGSDNPKLSKDGHTYRDNS